MNDEVLAKVLLERGLLTSEELESAQEIRRGSKRPLGEILVERNFLHRVQLEDAIAALEKRGRYCERCRSSVYVPRVTVDGDRCPQCFEPLAWKEETASSRIQEVESIVQMTEDKLPLDVQKARTSPANVFGKYILLEELGRGGYGVVRKAWDTMMGEYVALKFLREEQEEEDTKTEAYRRQQAQIMDLLQEARAALRLRHDHIVAMRDAGREGGQFYICLEYIDGDTLADHVRAAQMRGRLSALYEDPRFYLGVVRDIANAIHYAHTFPKPIIHCDLKPGNVLISVQGCAYVLDFGLSRTLNEEGQVAWAIRGTPSYMAPEQLQADPALIGVRTDVYGLGAILYELLAGRPMFSGERDRVLEQASRELPERPMDVFRRTEEAKRRDSVETLNKIRRLDAVSMRCLAKPPRERYTTARDVAIEIETALAALGAATPAPAAAVPERVRTAQQNAEFLRIDALLASLRLEEALKEAEKLRNLRNTILVHRWVDLRRKQIEILERMRGRMAERLNERRPRLARLQLVEGQLEGVEILKATPKRIFVFFGEKSRELEWSLLPAAQILALAETLQLGAAEDRLALGILCHHAQLSEQASRYLKSLAGTPLEGAAKEVEQPA